jgi:hypothetical protein
LGELRRSPVHFRNFVKSIQILLTLAFSLDQTNDVTFSTTTTISNHDDNDDSNHDDHNNRNDNAVDKTSLVFSFSF